MPHILKNKNIAVHVDLPSEGYSFSRFDWTGKISRVTFNDTPMTGREKPDDQNEVIFGKGLYNEFGIDTALGFEEAEVGSWFHKIGIGLLKKDSSEYFFHKSYQVRPSKFKWITEPEKIVITCESEQVNGYAYFLEKEITLSQYGFNIQYSLKNSGERQILTQEYNHNFLALGNALMEPNYILKFPFEIRPEKFEESVNPENMVEIGSNSVGFNGTPREQFFFSNLSGSEKVKAQWELIHKGSKKGIRETGSFLTKKVNLWGWRHVMSPELFVDLQLDPGESQEWSRKYEMFEYHE
jgi:hypothetical protein